jgi:hypothetical protein
VEATSALTINGAAAGIVTFWHTTWGNWQIVEKAVRLVRGWNTVTLTKSTFYAEVDAFYVSYGQVREQPPTPVVPATAVRYEAESGVINNAHVRPDSAASGGAVVGGLDFPDSSITWQVCVAEGGPKTIAIRYTNGSERGGYALEAVHSLTVNGALVGEVTYRHTQWGNWQTVARRVVLQQGCNTVTLTRVAWYAEIDYIDVY